MVELKVLPEQILYREPVYKEKKMRRGPTPLPYGEERAKAFDLCTQSTENDELADVLFILTYGPYIFLKKRMLKNSMKWTIHFILEETQKNFKKIQFIKLFVLFQQYTLYGACQLI